MNCLLQGGDQLLRIVLRSQVQRHLRAVTLWEWKGELPRHWGAWRVSCHIAGKSDHFNREVIVDTLLHGDTSANWVLIRPQLSRQRFIDNRHTRRLYIIVW